MGVSQIFGNVIVNSQSEHTHSLASFLMKSVLHYKAMWFLLAAEIQSVRKVSHENERKKDLHLYLPWDQTRLIQHFH